MRFNAIIAVLAASAASAEAATRRLAVSGDKCLVIAGKINSNEYALALGDCSDNDALDVLSMGDGLVRTTDYCLSSKGNSSHDGAQVVLAKCNMRKKGMRWSLDSDGSMSNAHRYCIAYDELEGTLVQAQCEGNAFQFRVIV
jgi:hypothetical protein